MDYEIVEIIWIDAWSDEAHLKIEAIADFNPITRQNVGLLIENTGERVVITSGLIQNVFPGETLIDGILVIPRGMIKEINHLERFIPGPGTVVMDKP